MFNIVQFDDGKYGLQNQWTGVVLTKKSGKVRTYRTIKAASRGGNKIVRSMNKMIRSLDHA